MELPAIPVVNGVLPRPQGGLVRGVFMDPLTLRLLRRLGPKGEVFLCPFLPDRRSLYPLGVVARIENVWLEEVFCPGPAHRQKALFARVRGAARGKASGFRLEQVGLVAEGLEPVDLEELRSRGYPTVCGAGWRPLRGFTEVRSLDDLLVTLEGVDLEGGRRLRLSANLGGLVSPEQAHTIEHAILRALRSYSLCSPRTLALSLSEEGQELKDSVEYGFRHRMPEVFGVTRAGACGNPMTDLAHFYLSREVVEGLSRGQSLAWSVEEARRKTLSRLAHDLEVSTQAGLRVLQGLKKGMRHDDTRLSSRTAARVLERFPPAPWD
ncbi:MAG: hypothetical protein K6T75_06090 [Acetobacteraceae bacterium]|nr:hypothetical protein [Acetobacteraceae bacterium]